jgi:hypothetical protein
MTLSLTTGMRNNPAEKGNSVKLNDCPVYETLRVTPAMAAGLSKTVWEIEDLLKLID